MSSENLLPDIIAPNQPISSRQRKERFAELVFGGLTKKQVCLLLGISPPTYDAYSKDELVLSHLGQLQLDGQQHALMMQSRLRTASNELLTDLISLAKDTSVPPATRANVMMNLLDREGSIPTHAVRNEGGKRGIPDELWTKLVEGVAEEVENRRAIPVTKQ